MEQAHIIRGPNRAEYSPLNSRSFLKHNEEGAPQQLDVSGIEMMVMPTVSYTSLRDIMPHPTNASWHEIPIKNPLLKQAALAYLQPMSTPPEVGNKSFLDKFREKCFCGGAATSPEFGCLRWLNGGFFAALLGAFVGFFCERRRNRNAGQQNEDEDEDDEDEDEDNVE